MQAVEPSPQERRTLVIGDSLVRGLTRLNYADIRCFPGAGLRDFSVMMSEDHDIHGAPLHLASKQVVIILAGTNDLSRPFRQFKSAVWDIIRGLNSSSDSTALAFCTLLPRPVDFDWSEPRVQAVNHWFFELAARGEIAIVDTSKTFRTTCGSPKFNLFREDGLHLNEHGLARLRDRIRGQLMKLRSSGGVWRKLAASRDSRGERPL